MNTLIGEPRHLAGISAAELMSRLIKRLWPWNVSQDRVRPKHLIHGAGRVVCCGKISNRLRGGIEDLLEFLTILGLSRRISSATAGFPDPVFHYLAAHNRLT